MSFQPDKRKGKTINTYCRARYKRKQDYIDKIEMITTKMYNTGTLWREEELLYISHDKNNNKSKVQPNGKFQIVVDIYQKT